MSFKPIDPKRDEIRRYLERGSVVDSLTKIFIRVIKERPENPMEYIRNNIGVVRHQQDKYERLQQDLQTANDEIQRLRAIINSINPDVLKDQPPVQVNQPQQAHAEKQDQSEPTTEINGHVEPETVSAQVETAQKDVETEKPSEVLEDNELASIAEKQLKIGETSDAALEEVKAEQNAKQSSSVQVEVKNENNE